MYITIAIREIWKRFDEDSLRLKHLGLRVPDLLQLAFGYAALSTYPETPPHSPRYYRTDIFTAVRNLLIDRMPHSDRLPFTRQSGYGVDDQLIYQVVDMIGEISRMLADAVIRQLGSFPLQLRLFRCIGPDLILLLDEDSREFVHHRSSDSRPERL